MAAPTPTQLAANMSALVDRWNTYTKQMKDWLAGTADGGPAGDGRYPLTNFSGVTFMVECPAKQSARVSDTVDSADSFSIAAGASADAAEAAQLAAETARDVAQSYKDAAIAARDTSQLNADTAGSHAANALASANNAAASESNSAASASAAASSATAAADSATAAHTSETNAASSASAAAASAAAAATFNPSNYYLKTEGDARYRLVSTAIDYSSLSGIPSTFAPSAHTHAQSDITGLTAALAAKLDSAAFTWANLSGKPTTFTPSAHTHVMADVTDLAPALALKAPLASPTFTGTVTAPNLWSSAGYFTIAPYNATYDDGSRVETYYDGNSRRWNFYGKTSTNTQAGVDLYSLGALATGAVNGIRMVQGNFGAFWRNDGSNLYLLFTASGDQWGTFNALRPIAFNLTSGLLTSANGQSLGGGTTITGGLDFGSVVATTNTDLTKHIQLHVSANYGFNVTSGTLNYNVGTSGKHSFLYAGTEMFRIDTNGTYFKNANAATMTRQPRIFVQSTDPGAAAADGDLWIW